MRASKVGKGHIKIPTWIWDFGVAVWERYVNYICYRSATSFLVFFRVWFFGGLSFLDIIYCLSLALYQYSSRMTLHVSSLGI
jgi:hypothetical protein